MSGLTVLSCDEDTQTIQFSGAKHPKLQIESLDWMLDLDGISNVDLASLQGLKTDVATAFKDGSLEIRFERGGRLLVPFGKYEAWHVRADDTLHIVSVAGGGIAIWL